VSTVKSPTPQVRIRPDEELFPQIRGLYAELFPFAPLHRVEALPADMSPRRYFRIYRDGPSVIAMVFDSRAVPEAGGGTGLDSYDAVLLLTDYLAARGLPVPVIYGASNELSIVFEEDFGDRFLADHLAAEPESALKQYRRAIELIIHLQGAEHDPEFFALKRGFTAESYRREMEEIRDYYLPWKLGRKEHDDAILPAQKIASPVEAPNAIFDQCFEEIAKLLEQQKQVLVLRDYHCWNLLVPPGGELGVIDFQDALMATRCYDVVALLNDRDTDSALGEKSYNELLEYFFTQHPDGEQLRAEYPLVLLQRDLKVAGRLAKMVQLRGLTKYERWIPGTAARIRRTLLAKPTDPLFRKLLDALASVDPSFLP